VQTNHIGSGQQFIDVAPAKARPSRRVSWVPIGSDHTHAHGDGDLPYVAPYPAESHNTHRLFLQLDEGRFPEAEIWRSRPFSGVSRRAVKPDVMTEFEQECEDQLSH
jgi:hypothetical protein